MAVNGLIKAKQIDLDGLSGLGDKNIVYHQEEAASVWEFQHNLGKIPTFDFYTEDWLPIYGDFKPIGNNNGVVEFLLPIAGYVVNN